MTTQPVTLNLPETVYKQLRRAADAARRPVDAVLLDVVLAALPTLQRGRDGAWCSPGAACLPQRCRALAGRTGHTAARPAGGARHGYTTNSSARA